MALVADIYLWEHWKFNADQRLKAFNLYVVFSIFANGMVFTAFDKQAHALVFVFLGGFVALLAIVFGMVDRRSRKLLHLAKQGLKGLEQKLPMTCRPFALDDMHREPWARYTVAFNLLFAMQLLFGLIVIGFGVATLAGLLPVA
jgi:uncharacterized membrane protein